MSNCKHEITSQISCRCVDCGALGRFVIKDQRKRIALLEMVAEAAEQSIVNKHGIWVGPTVMQTLKAAGYLGGGDE